MRKRKYGPLAAGGWRDERYKTAMPPANQFIPLQDFCSRKKNATSCLSRRDTLCGATDPGPRV